jgi:small GTP-binding protein
MTWEMPPPIRSTGFESTRYTVAKIALVGETGAGKTALANRLCENDWRPTESTHGMQVRRLSIGTGSTANIEREVWLWDFAGQPDYRLIHQLYMDETALALLVFNPQDQHLLETLGYWAKALHASSKYLTVKVLVGGRCDRGGLLVSQKLISDFCTKHGVVENIKTSAKTGEGCEDLKRIIAAHIPWERLPWTSTTHMFKMLKDAILELRRACVPIIRWKELRQRLEIMLPTEMFGSRELRTVIGLMQGQGLLHVLGFGDYVLMQPEQLNLYASIVVKMAREHVDEMGAVPEEDVLNGDLRFGDFVDARLTETDERILLRALVQIFIDRALCIREQTPNGTMLVFPSYFRRDKPEIPQHPHILVTYTFTGAIEEIYSTLVVRLSYSEVFIREQLWKNAADFATAGGKRAGIAMRDSGEGSAEMIVYFENRVPEDTQVTFIRFVHEHLQRRAKNVVRFRMYVCRHCGFQIENRAVVQKRLQDGKRDIVCANCEGRVELLDLIESKFTSARFVTEAKLIGERSTAKLDNESKDLVLIGHVYSVVGEAGQIFRTTTNSDWGIDGEIEFKDDEGRASGNRVYLQLKSGDSHLTIRQSDGKEVFSIRNTRHVEYWQSHRYPVMLVIRPSNGRARWMSISDYLAEHKGEQGLKQVVFDGEEFTAANVIRLREKLFAVNTRSMR